MTAPSDDRGSFESFVAGRSTALVRTAYLLTGERTAAEDLVQSALVKVAPHWDRICRDGWPEAYVRRVIYREHVSAWRRRGPARLSAFDEAMPDVSIPDHAETLGCSVGTVCSQSAKALARLRKLLPAMSEEVPSA